MHSDFHYDSVNIVRSLGILYSIQVDSLISLALELVNNAHGYLHYIVDINKKHTPGDVNSTVHYVKRLLFNFYNMLAIGYRILQFLFID